jgi:diguanylate cyclase (GGDEF)-like protein
MASNTAYTKSPFARRLFLVFIVSAALPVLTLAALAFTTVTEQLLEQNRLRQTQEVKTFGLSIFDRLDLLERELQLLETHDSHALSMALDGPDNTSRVRLDEKLDSLWLYSDGSVMPILGEPPPIDEALLANIDLSAGSSLLTSRSPQGDLLVFMVLAETLQHPHSNILLAEIKPGYLWAVDTFEADKHYCVFERSGDTLFCTDGAPITHQAFLQQIGNDSFSGHSILESEDRGSELMSWWSLFLSGRFSVQDWIVMISVPRSEVLQPISDFRNTFLSVFSITLLLVVLLSSAQIRRILVPLKQLSKAIHAMGNTEFNKRVEIDSGDEFAELAESFNSMGRKLADQFQSLNTMAEIDRLILASQDAEQVVQIVLARIKDIVDCAEIGIAIQNKDGGFSKMFISSANKADKQHEIESSFELQEHELQFLERNREGALLSFSQDQGNTIEALKDFRSAACIVLPLYIEDSLSALVVLGYPEEPENPRQVIHEARNWADRVAVALSNAKWQEKLFRQANFDALTNLPNRPAFRSHLKQALARARRNGEFVGVLFIDLDRFKLVNDTLGHAAGDEFLQCIANRLSRCIRSTDMLARLGGDEFTIVIAESPSYEHMKQSITAVADKLLSVIPEPMLIRDQELRTNASIGISIFPLDGDNIEDLIRNADSAMYHAKSNDGGNYHYYSEELNKVISEQLRIENDIRLAVENDEFELYYQPQVETGSGRILGGEALIRWHHPNNGFVSPGLFIPIAEESQLIVEIDKWVINAACIQLRNWRDENRPLVRIAVNLSARFFRQPGVIDILQTITKRHQIAPEYLELEITEGTLIQDIESAILVLKELTELGFQLTIDDFGTGYSSLTYLKKLPIHKLKIDKSFVDHCSEDNVDGSLVKTIINMAKTLELACIAEGVELKEQLEFLKSNGCAEIQGYYFSKPKPAAEFAEDYLIRQDSPLPKTSAH